jgi:hypothetical protein
MKGQGSGHIIEREERCEIKIEIDMGDKAMEVWD